MFSHIKNRSSSPHNKIQETEYGKFKSIRSSVLLHISIKNFLNNLLRSTLTVLAVTIGVFATFFLLSFGLGIQGLVTQQVVGNDSLKSIVVSSPNSKVIKLDEKAVNEMRAYSHVKQIGVQYSFPGIVTIDGGESDVVVYGMDKAYQDMNSFKVTRGHLLDTNDSNAVVLNQSALKAVNARGFNQKLNQKVKMTIPLYRAGAKKQQITDEFTIVGIIESTSGAGSEAYVSSKVFDNAEVPVYNYAKITIDNVDNAPSIRDRIRRNGFSTTSPIDTLNEINNIFKYFNIVLVGLGGIGMVVAILGMFNSLTISLLEQTREIGLMLILGARRSDMRKLLIQEAVIISLIGSILGILLSVIVSRLVNLYINLGAMGRGVKSSFDMFAMPFWAIASVIIGTVLIGVIIVYFPARRAEKIDPVEALRHD